MRCVLFFFFKQKTAYDMRISDWSSDVCSSDLELGYAALACDLHGEAKLYDDLATVMGLLEPMQKDPLRTRARAEGGLKALRARAEVDSGRIDRKTHV